VRVANRVLGMIERNFVDIAYEFSTTVWNYRKYSPTDGRQFRVQTKHMTWTWVG